MPVFSKGSIAFCGGYKRSILRNLPVHCTRRKKNVACCSWITNRDWSVFDNTEIYKSQIKARANVVVISFRSRLSCSTTNNSFCWITDAWYFPYFNSYRSSFKVYWIFLLCMKTRGIAWMYAMQVKVSKSIEDIESSERYLPTLPIVNCGSDQMKWTKISILWR